MNHITSSIHFFNNVCHFLCVVHARYSSILAENTPEWLYFSSAGYHTVDHSFYSYFTLLSNLLFLPVFFEYFTSYLDWTLVPRLRYLVWLVLTMDSYASRSTQTAIWFGFLITYFRRYLEGTWGVLVCNLPYLLQLLTFGVNQSLSQICLLRLRFLLRKTRVDSDFTQNF